MTDKEFLTGSAIDPELAKPEPGKVKRQPVDFNFESLNWDFIHLMAKIANYANTKYGSAVQYTNARLEGGNSPINHIVGHVREYSKRQVHDRFGNLEMQLAAIAYNAMMEYYYLHNGGPTVPDQFYKEMGK